MRINSQITKMHECHLKKIALMYIVFCFHCGIGQTQLSDSLYRIAFNYDNGYQLEGTHDAYFQKKIEAYYKMSIEKDSLNKSAHQMLQYFYLYEVLFFLNQTAEYELHPPKTQEQKKRSEEATKYYNEWFDKLKKSKTIYERLFLEDSSKNSVEYIPDPFYLNNRPKQ